MKWSISRGGKAHMPRARIRRGEEVSSLAVLILRFVLGGLLAGHGAQKLFGWFGGPGLQGTSEMVESIDLQPARPWAVAAGLSEFGGGVLMILGLLNPVGPLGAIGSMVMASVKVHAGKPIWVTEGGAELPVTNMAIATALMLNGPGKYSLDRALGIRWPRELVAILGLVIVALTVAIATRDAPPPQEAEDEARGELAGEEDT
jgi:putative oxidoreductase